MAILAGDFLLARACIVRSTSGVAEGLAVARRFADVAAAALDPVEETVARSLAGLAHSLLGDVTGA